MRMYKQCPFACALLGERNDWLFSHFLGDLSQPVLRKREALVAS